jgi:hypothetical protein
VLRRGSDGFGDRPFLPSLDADSADVGRIGEPWRGGIRPPAGLYSTERLVVPRGAHLTPEHRENLHRLLDEYRGCHRWTLGGVPTVGTRT